MSPIHKCFICGSQKVSLHTTEAEYIPLCEKHAALVNSAWSNRKNTYTSKVFGSKKKGIIKSDRSFGCELECFSSDNSNAKDISALLIRKLHHIGSDASINVPGYSRYINDTELRTCPLRGLKGEQELKNICDTLVALNHEVNSSCGTHCHIAIPEAKKTDTSDIVEGRLKNLLYFYRVFEPVIRALLTEDRRSNSYCWPLTQATPVLELDNLTREPAGLFKDRKRFDMYFTGTENKAQAKISKRSGGGRWGRLGINFNSLYEHATLEIRYHQGTLDAVELIHWIALHSAMIDLVMEGSIDEKEIAVYARMDNLKKLLIGLLGLLDGRITRSTHLYTIKRFNTYKHLNPPDGYIT